MLDPSKIDPSAPVMSEFEVRRFARECKRVEVAEDIALQRALEAAWNAPRPEVVWSIQQLQENGSWAVLVRPLGTFGQLESLAIQWMYERPGSEFRLVHKDGSCIVPVRTLRASNT